jgi:hypothetical protein
MASRNYTQHPNPNTLAKTYLGKADMAYIIDLREKKIWSAVAELTLLFRYPAPCLKNHFSRSIGAIIEIELRLAAAQCGKACLTETRPQLQRRLRLRFEA